MKKELAIIAMVIRFKRKLSLTLLMTFPNKQGEYPDDIIRSQIRICWHHIFYPAAPTSEKSEDNLSLTILPRSSPINLLLYLFTIS